MVEVPSGFVSLWPLGSSATVLRRWALGYANQYGFTSEQNVTHLRRRHLDMGWSHRQFIFKRTATTG